MKNDPDYYKQCHDIKYQVVRGDSCFAPVCTAVDIYKREQRHIIGILTSNFLVQLMYKNYNHLPFIYRIMIYRITQYIRTRNIQF